MNQPQILKTFEYTVPASSFLLAGYKSKNQQLDFDYSTLMKLVIDFEAGDMLLEGDWSYMLSENPHRVLSRSSVHRERVFVEAKISLTMPLNLSDIEMGGLVFPIEGIIKDKFSLSSCTGMIVFETKADAHNQEVNQSCISIYLYDLQSEGVEIMFKFPIYLSSGDTVEN